ncbi:hypothetical protein [Nitrosomonas communis]|nr:hypothetical protein [Nitrosomonas communis]
MISGYIAGKLGHCKLLLLAGYGLTLLGQILIALALSDDAGPFRFVLWLSLIPGLLAVVSFLMLVQGRQHLPNLALKFFGLFHI